MEAGVVAKFSLRRYDTQARVSVLASVVSIVSLLGLSFVVLQNMNFTELVIYYGPARRLAVFGGTAVTLLLAAIGFGMGLNSVGQRRNERQGLSWLGFFLGAGVLCLTLVVFALFHFRGWPAGR
jgi:hypothetical protein